MYFIPCFFEAGVYKYRTVFILKLSGNAKLFSPGSINTEWYRLEIFAYLFRLGIWKKRVQYFNLKKQGNLQSDGLKFGNNYIYKYVNKLFEKIINSK